MITPHLVIPAPDDEPGWQIFLNAIGAATRDDLNYIDSNIAKGTVKMLRMGSGIYLRIWSMSVSSNGCFLKRKWENSTIVLSLLYVFNPEFFFLRQTGFSLQLNKPDAPAMMLIPSAAATRFELASYHNVQLVEIGLTADFFQDWKEGQFLLSMDSKVPVIRLKMCSLAVTAQLTELYRKATDPGTNTTEIDEMISFLTSALLTDFTTGPSKAEPSERIHNLERIYALEKEITANLRQPLLPLGELARKAATSESSLKRQFKAVFGKGIYQYYLFKKMQLAKMILEERRVTVNILAEEMGYQKASHFINQFKKHHGYAPGEMIRKLKSTE